MSLTPQAVRSSTASSTGASPGTSPGPDELEFARQWGSVRPQILALCRRALADGGDAGGLDADDIVGRIALRAWRGYGSFRGDSAFGTWAVAIARREIVRARARQDARRLAETSLEEIQEHSPERLPSSPPSDAGLDAELESGVEQRPTLASLVRQAALRGEITDSEARVMLARMKQPGLGWSQLGAEMGLDGAACAVAHCRAVPKLRVFLFLNRPDFLGGQSAVLEAFEAACTSAREPLNAAEAEVFRSVVLERKRAYRRPGWRLALRSACGKVIRHLPMP